MSGKLGREIRCTCSKMQGFGKQSNGTAAQNSP